MMNYDRHADCDANRQESPRGSQRRARHPRVLLLILMAVLNLGAWQQRAWATLVGYWPLDEGSGTTVGDASGNGVTGMLDGALLPTWTGGSTGIPGDGALSFATAGQAGRVDGGTLPGVGVGSSRVAFGFAPSITLTGNETISMWIRPLASPRRQNIFGISYSGAGAIVLENVNALTQVQDGFNFYYGSGGDNCCSHNTGVDSTPITRDGSTWTHVVFRRDSAAGGPPWTSNIFFNGVDVTTTAGVGHDVNEVVTNLGTSPVYLGAGYVNSFEGLIDDAAIWDQALTDGEVAALYHARGVSTSPLLARDIDVSQMEQLFQLHRDAGSDTLEIGDLIFQYSADVGAQFPALALGESVQVGNQVALLLDASGTGLLGAAVPEPSTCMLLAMGGLVFMRRTRKRFPRVRAASFVTMKSAALAFTAISFCIALLALPANAALLLSEDFTYPNGNIDGTQNGGSEFLGSSWDSPWTQTAGNAGQIDIFNNQLRLNPTGAEAAAQMTASRSFSLNSAPNETLYFAYDLTWVNDNEGNFRHFLQFLGTNVRIGVFNDQYQITLAGNTQTTGGGPKFLAHADPRTMLGRLEFNPGGNETLTFWVNPTSELDAPTLTASAELGASDLGSIVEFFKFNQDQNLMFIDDLRLGTDFQFTPIIIPEPSTGSIMLLGLTGWLGVRRRRREA